MVKFVFSHSKLRKQPFLLNISKFKGGLALPSDAHGGDVKFALVQRLEGTHFPSKTFHVVQQGSATYGPQNFPALSSFTKL